MDSESVTEQEKVETTVYLLARLNATTKILTQAIENRNTALAMFASFKLNEYVNKSALGDPPIPMLIKLLDRDYGTKAHEILASEATGEGVTSEYFRLMDELVPPPPWVTGRG